MLQRFRQWRNNEEIQFVLRRKKGRTWEWVEDDEGEYIIFDYEAEWPDIDVQYDLEDGKYDLHKIARDDEGRFRHMGAVWTQEVGDLPDEDEKIERAAQRAAEQTSASAEESPEDLDDVLVRGLDKKVDEMSTDQFVQTVQSLKGESTPQPAPSGRSDLDPRVNLEIDSWWDMLAHTVLTDPDQLDQQLDIIEERAGSLLDRGLGSVSHSDGDDRDEQPDRRYQRESLEPDEIGGTVDDLIADEPDDEPMDDATAEINVEDPSPDQPDVDLEGDVDEEPAEESSDVDDEPVDEDTEIPDDLDVEGEVA